MTEFDEMLEGVEPAAGDPGVDQGAAESAPVEPPAAAGSGAEPAPTGSVIDGEQGPDPRESAPDVPVPAVSAKKAADAMQKIARGAREFATAGGKCKAYAPRGTVCKLCGKKHS